MTSARKHMERSHRSHHDRARAYTFYTFNRRQYERQALIAQKKVSQDILSRILHGVDHIIETVKNTNKKG